MEKNTHWKWQRFCDLRHIYNPLNWRILFVCVLRRFGLDWAISVLSSNEWNIEKLNDWNNHIHAKKTEWKYAFMDRSGSWIIYWKSRHRCSHITNMYNVCCRIMQSKINSKCYSRRQAIDYFSIGNIQFAWIVGTWHSIISKKRESRRCNVLQVKLDSSYFKKWEDNIFIFTLLLAPKNEREITKNSNPIYGCVVYLNRI